MVRKLDRHAAQKPARFRARSGSCSSGCHHLHNSIEIKSGQIILRAVQIDLEEQIPLAFLDNLTNAERARLAAFVKLADQWRFVAGRALIRHVLQREFGIVEYTFMFGDHGRPELLVGGVRSSVDVNISHGGAFVVCGCAEQMRLGVDVEPIAAFYNFKEIAPYYLQPGELALLHDRPSSKQQNIAALYWVLKEAVLKCLGSGFSIDPRELFLQLPQEPEVWRKATGSNAILYLRLADAYVGLAADAATLCAPNVKLFKLPELLDSLV